MDLYKLWVVLCIVLRPTQNKVSWVDQEYSGVTLTAEDQERVMRLEAIANRQRYGITLGQVVADPDPLVICFNWCMSFGPRWTLTESYAQFLDYVTKHNYRTITQVPNYAEYFRIPFEYVYKAAECSLGGFDVTKLTYIKGTQSFLLEWLQSNIERCSVMPYATLLDTFGYGTNTIGRDAYFEAIVNYWFQLERDKIDAELEKLTSHLKQHLESGREQWA